MQKQFFANEISAHFNLRKRHTDRPTNIYFVMVIGGKQIKIPTLVKIYPNHWNGKKQKPLISSSLSELDNQNNAIVLSTINTMKSNFQRYIEYLCNNPNEIHRAKALAIEFISPMAKRTSNKQPLAVIRSGIIASTTIGDSTKKQYQSWLKVFEQFLDAHNISLNSFDDWTYDIMQEFRDYLQMEYVNPKGERNSVRHINKQMEHVKTLLKNYSTPHYLTKSKVEDICDIKPLKNKVDSHNNEIALRDDEIYKLYNYKATTIQDERIKDMFVLDCLTGQRISDIEKLDKTMDNDRGIETIQLVQRKTDQKIEVDFIFELARLILMDKYHGKLPLEKNAEKLISSNIQRIAKEAGLCGSVIRQEQRGTETKTTSTTLQRWECVKTHTARRTFISLLKIRGWDSTKIMHYTGHRNEKTVNGYCKLTQTDYRTFNKLQKEHPEMVLQFTMDYTPIMPPSDSSNITPQTPPSSLDSAIVDKLEQSVIEKYRLQEENKRLQEANERQKQESERQKRESVFAESIEQEYLKEQLRSEKDKNKRLSLALEFGLSKADIDEIEREQNEIAKMTDNIDWADEEKDNCK